MSQQLQQPNTGLQTAGREAGVAVSRVPLIANNSLLLLLALIIIPTISGVALIA